MSRSESSREIFKIVGMISLFVLFFIFHVALRTKIVSETYELDKLRNENKKLEARLYSLKAQKNEIMGPRGLEAKVQELKNKGVELRNPKTDQIIFVQVEARQP